MKKWKIAGLIASQATLTYAVFVICIHEPKSIYQQVQESVGVEKDILHNKEVKINSIMFNHFEHPTTVTIEQIRKDSKPNFRRSGFDLLSKEDAAFLVDLPMGNKWADYPIGGLSVRPTYHPLVPYQILRDVPSA